MVIARPATVVAVVVALIVGTLGLVAPAAAADTPTPTPTAPQPTTPPTTPLTTTPPPTTSPTTPPPTTPPTYPSPRLVCPTNTKATVRAGSHTAGNAPMGAGNFFSFPNRSSAERFAIRNRVLNTIKATNGCYYTGRDDTRTPQDERIVRYGIIRIATWSYNDWGIQDALRAARARGVVVQVLAARSINVREKYQPWIGARGARKSFGYRSPVPVAMRNDLRSWATDCSGACRGRGGTPHSKFFLFTDVGTGHISNISVSTSMNLTRFAYVGQWNQATVWWRDATVYNRFKQIFFDSAARRRTGFKAWRSGSAHQMFFPKGTPSRDPVLYALNRVRCYKGTRVRVIQYSMYAKRGNAIAKKLRSLWNQGCDVRIIYSITSRPVLKILRSRSGRGKVPMKQSVTKNRRGQIVKYNHSKWVAISGGYNGRAGQWTALAGSSNWSDFAYSCDEQMQQTFGYSATAPFFANFTKTWGQKNSRPPAYGRVGAGNGVDNLRAIPKQPTFGRGIYKHISKDEG